MARVLHLRRLHHGGYPELTLGNFAALFNPSNFDIILRTLAMAVAVSLASAVLAFPIAYYMARYTRGKTKAFFYIAVMMPMWASYIVKTYAWTLLLAKGGVAQWFIQQLHLGALLEAVLAVPGVGGSTLSTSHLGRFMVFVYIWLPFMILPIQASWSACRRRCCRLRQTSEPGPGKRSGK